MLLLLDQDNVTGVVAATAVTGSWKMNLIDFIHETKSTRKKEMMYATQKDRSVRSHD